MCSRMTAISSKRVSTLYFVAEATAAEIWHFLRAVVIESVGEVANCVHSNFRWRAISITWAKTN